jgi:hypothetical protein
VLYTSPTQISAVTSILEVDLATVTGSGVSSLPDALNSNPAVQATDGARPPRVSAANGLLVMQPSNDLLSLPAISANNQLTTWGFGAHVKLDDLTTSKFLLRYGPNTTFDPVATDSHNVRVLADESVFLQVFNNALGTSARNAVTPASVLNSTDYKFLTVEINLPLVGEANQVLITTDNVIHALTFGNSIGAPGAMPAALQGQPGGTNIVLFAEWLTSAITPFIGKLGPKLYFFGSAMAGVTRGLLTSDARAFLANHRRPT